MPRAATWVAWAPVALADACFVDGFAGCMEVGLATGFAVGFAGAFAGAFACAFACAFADGLAPRFVALFVARVIACFGAGADAALAACAGCRGCGLRAVWLEDVSRAGAA